MFLREIKLCRNLFLFSNYLASCSCFEIRFFENWVPYITWFYHFQIMWKFCHTRLRRRGFTCFKKFKLELNFKFGRKKMCNPILNIPSLSEIPEPAHALSLSFSRITYLPFFLLQSRLSPMLSRHEIPKSNPKSPNPNRWCPN